MGFTDSGQDIAALVKEQADIVQIIAEHVELKRSGIRYLGLCPFHGEKTPSFSVHSGQQFFHCFGCGESGDVFSFVMKYYNVDFPTALKQLADKFNIALPEKQVSAEEQKKRQQRLRMFSLTEKVAKIYHDYLFTDAGAEEGRRYLAKRGIPETIQKRFFLGFAPPKERAGWDYLTRQLNVEDLEIARQIGVVVKNDRGGYYDRFRDRVLFPISNSQGQICGFGGRIVGEGQPKYMNSPESYIFNKSKLLLGLHQQSQEIRKEKQAIIVEGNFDMISLVVHGCGNVVAPLGTALTSSQIRLLKRNVEEAVLLFDGDEAGIKAAQRSAPLFLQEQMHARIALLPTGHDPDTFIREEGLDALKTLIDSAEELPEFFLSQLIQQYGLSLEGKTRIAEELKPLIAAATSPLQRSVIISHFSEKLKVPEHQLAQALKGVKQSEMRRQKPQKVQKPQQREILQPLTAAQKRLVEFMVLNPRFLNELEEHGVRDVLQGSLGEIIFLQIKMLTKKNSDVQPEEILSGFQEGPERSFVSETLLAASLLEEAAEATERKELAELTEWLELENMRKQSTLISKHIEEAQLKGDFDDLENLLIKKQNIEKEMRKFRN